MPGMPALPRRSGSRLVCMRWRPQAGINDRLEASLRHPASAGRWQHGASSPARENPYPSLDESRTKPQLQEVAAHGAEMPPMPLARRGRGKHARQQPGSRLTGDLPASSTGRGTRADGNGRRRCRARKKSSCFCRSSISPRRPGRGRHRRRRNRPDQLRRPFRCGGSAG